MWPLMVKALMMMVMMMMAMTIMVTMRVMEVVFHMVVDGDDDNDGGGGNYDDDGDENDNDDVVDDYGHDKMLMMNMSARVARATDRKLNSSRSSVSTRSCATLRDTRRGSSASLSIRI